MLYKVALCLLLVLYAKAAKEGEPCTKDGVRATCININNCPSALKDIRDRKRPQECDFSGPDPIVCCVNKSQVIPGATTTKRPVVSTTEYVPPTYDYKTNDESGGCEPIAPNRTAAKTGRKAWDNQGKIYQKFLKITLSVTKEILRCLQCLEYQEAYVYPCERERALTGEVTRVDHCGHNADELILGGVDAAKKEFPHMVLLGYGDRSETAQWLCGGTLISDRFILTAGHCTFAKDVGPVTFVITAALKRSDQVDARRLYGVKRIIKHPDYKSPIKYNDIALLETDTLIQLDQWAVPACLDISNNSNSVPKAIATGWGDTQYKGSLANTLQKVILTKFETPECSVKFPKNRNMPTGFEENTQTCFGDRTKSKDTCQGDSGGPLQVKSKQIHCMYTIVGVTSFGKACGWIGVPGIYTRVAPFVPWIESVVWS